LLHCLLRDFASCSVFSGMFHVEHRTMRAADKVNGATQVSHFASAQGAPECHVTISALRRSTRNAFASHALFWQRRRTGVDLGRASLRLCSAADLSS
ncbi:MAG: hypothetical protein AABZ10_16150, partial [Nitrospirota bacterium]